MTCYQGPKGMVWWCNSRSTFAITQLWTIVRQVIYCLGRGLGCSTNIHFIHYGLLQRSEFFFFFFFFFLVISNPGFRRQIRSKESTLSVYESFYNESLDMVIQFFLKIWWFPWKNRRFLKGYLIGLENHGCKFKEPHQWPMGFWCHF
jgi:hypothetical protein